MRNTTTPPGPRISGSRSRTRVLGLVMMAAATVAAMSAGCDPAVQTHGSASARPSSAAPRTSTSTPASTSPMAGSTPGDHPMILFYQTTPRTELATVPPGTRLIPIQDASSTRDGMTLYLGFTIDGGKCGTYEVVIQSKRKGLDAGVVHLIDHGQACATQDTSVMLVVKLSSPLGLRPVVDLATGRPVVAYAA